MTSLIATRRIRVAVSSSLSLGFAATGGPDQCLAMLSDRWPRRGVPRLGRRSIRDLGRETPSETRDNAQTKNTPTAADDEDARPRQRKGTSTKFRGPRRAT